MPPHRSGAATLMLCLIATVLVTLPVACAPASPSAAGAGRTLFVANGEAGTISRLDSASGRLTGPPLPAGRAPWQIASGPDGNLLVLSIAPRQTSEIVFLRARSGGYAAGRVQLEHRAREGQLAGDGHLAVVLYHQPLPAGAGAEPRCRMATVDLQTGALVATHTVCGEHETALSVAVEAGPGAALAYVGLWRWPHIGSDGQWRSGGGRIAVIDAVTGAVLGGRTLSGAPGTAVLARSPQGEGRRLYVVHADPGPHTEYASPERWELLAFDPPALDQLSSLGLAESPQWLTVSPDGSAAYYIVGGRNSVMRVDLHQGSVRQLAKLPGIGLGLAVSHDRVFVPQPNADRVAVFDRHTGAPRPSLPTGRHPIGLRLEGD